MRISDWSSDVCSSDLVRRRGPGRITCRCIDPLRARGGDRAPGAGGLTDRRQRPGALLARFRRHRAWNPGLASQDAAIQPWTVAGEAGGRSFRQQRSEEHTSELQSLMRISYAVFCLKKKNKTRKTQEI